MKHLLFWTYFAIAAYFLMGASVRPTSESLMNAAATECKNVPEGDMQRLYCMASYVKAQCIKGLDLRLCGETERQ